MDHFNEEERHIPATDKNLEEMIRERFAMLGETPSWVSRDLYLCIRNILVQRCLFGAEDPESLAHSSQTLVVARQVISFLGLKIDPNVRRFVKRIKSRADSQPEGSYYGNRVPCSS